jgi:hypothetical protein
MSSFKELVAERRNIEGVLGLLCAALLAMSGYALYRSEVAVGMQERVSSSVNAVRMAEEQLEGWAPRRV